MSEKKSPKERGVYAYSGGGPDDAVGVDDLRARSKGRRDGSRERPTTDEGAGFDASSASDELPLPPEHEPSAAHSEPRAASPKATMPATPRTKGIPVPDARLPEVEKALARGDWAAVSQLLGPSGDPGNQAAALRFIWAIATKEASAAAGTRVDAIAIEAMAELLDVAKESPVALVLAKRTLRRRAWASTPAPTSAISSLIIVLGVGAGAAIGWLLSILLL